MATIEQRVDCLENGHSWSYSFTHYAHLCEFYNISRVCSVCGKEESMHAKSVFDKSAVKRLINLFGRKKC